MLISYCATVGTTMQFWLQVLACVCCVHSVRLALSVIASCVLTWVRYTSWVWPALLVGGAPASRRALLGRCLCLALAGGWHSLLVAGPGGDPHQLQTCKFVQTACPKRCARVSQLVPACMRAQSSCACAWTCCVRARECIHSCRFQRKRMITLISPVLLTTPIPTPNNPTTPATPTPNNPLPKYPHPAHR